MSTIPELVPGYVEVGFPKAKAVRYIVDSHMRSAIARGKGRKASKRAQELIYALSEAVGRDLVALEQRIAHNRRQWAADDMAERYSESRQRKALADVVNFHEG